MAFVRCLAWKPWALTVNRCGLVPIIGMGVITTGTGAVSRFWTHGLPVPGPTFLKSSFWNSFTHPFRALKSSRTNKEFHLIQQTKLVLLGVKHILYRRPGLLIASLT